MTALDNVLSALSERGLTVRPRYGYYMAQCPAHEDRQPSLSVREVDGKVLLYCQAGCYTRDDVAPALGLAMSDLFDEERDTAARPIVVAEYPYTDEHGTILFIKERRVPKDFRIKRPDGTPGMGDAARVLYRLPDVLKAVAEGRPVYVVEGEKDADALAARGYTATCNFDGAAKDGQRPKWRAEYSDTLKGADVIIIADRDEAGRAHAAAVLASLNGKAKSAVILEAAKGKDATDHLNAGLTPDDFRPLGSTDADDQGDEAGDWWQPIADQYETLDWFKVWEDTPEEIDWLIEPIIERGQLISIYSPPKAGKSLITLEFAAGLATGRPVLGNPARDPMRVLYVDIENTPKDIKDRLTAMGYGPADLTNLRYLSFPSLPALDSQRGGQHLLAVALAHEAELVIIDTVSRVISGSENDADTFASLYRYALAPLKGLGVAVIRLDHSGKDVAQGQRGSSAKASDVDTVWLLVKKTDTALCFQRQETRSGRGEPLVELVRKFEPLRHELANGYTISAQISDIIKRLDTLGVPNDAGRERAREALSAAGVKVANKHLAEAIRTRKLRLDLSRTGDDAVPADLISSAVPDAVPANQKTADQTCPGQVADSADNASRVISDDLSAAGPSLKDGQRDRSAHLSPDPNYIGPCQSCGKPCNRYGPEGAPVCAACREDAA